MIILGDVLRVLTKSTIQGRIIFENIAHALRLAGTISPASSKIPILRASINLTSYREHLYRCHMAPIHCSRCWVQFKDQEEYWAHTHATCICELQPRPALKGITPEIEARLRSRKPSLPRQSDEQKWREIYSLLFPNEEVPDPCKQQPLYLKEHD